MQLKVTRMDTEEEAVYWLNRGSFSVTVGLSLFGAALGIFGLAATNILGDMVTPAVFGGVLFIAIGSIFWLVGIIHHYPKHLKLLGKRSLRDFF